MSKKFSGIFIFLLSIGTTQHASAQVMQRKTRLITLNGDTIIGFINDKNWLINPSNISFYTSYQTDEKKYSPADIKAFIIDSGDYYLSANVHVDRNYSKTINLSETYSTDSISKEYIFLRVLFVSKLSLYLFTDENNKDHFYSNDEANNYIELIYKKTPIQISNETKLLTNSRYKNMLQYLMRSCERVTAKIDNTEYAEDALLKLFKEYEECQAGTQKIYESKSQNNHVSVHVLIGYDRTQLRFSGEDIYSELQNGSFSVSQCPNIGFRLIVPVKRSLDRYNFVAELSWKQYDTKARYSGNYYSIYDVHFQMNYLKLNGAFQYKYLTHGVQPFINVGLSLSYLVNQINDMHKVNTSPYIASYYNKDTYGDAFHEPSKFDSGIFGSVGLNYKKINFEFRYESAKGFSDYAGLISSLETFYVLLSYKI